MVQTDISQVAAECAGWRQDLRNFRNEFSQSQKDLESLCRSHLSKDQFLHIEHFTNQFHIQLINIHDLKKDIKLHEHQIQTELGAQQTLSEATLHRHEALYDQFSRMATTLMDLRNEFQQFSKQTT